MKKNTEEALQWVVRLLQENSIPFQIRGGLAARLYGVERELADIDIAIPASAVKKVASLVQEYLVYGPERYCDNEWDTVLMTLQFNGQEIDIEAAEEIKNFDVVHRRWVAIPVDFGTSEYIEAYGLRLPVIAKEDLIAYKNLIKREVDCLDLKILVKDIKD